VDWRLSGFGAVRAHRPSWNQIVPGLLVGEYPNLVDLPWLRDDHGVTAIVSLQDDADLASKRLRLREIEAECATLGLDFHRHPIMDGDTEALAYALPRVVTTLERLLADGGCVYLHCNAGYNRAPTAAIAFLHVRRGLSIPAATTLVKEKRSCVPYLSAIELAFVPPR
jgi:protein-tyrosine phosphatase